MTVRLSVNINDETESDLKTITAQRHARWTKRGWFRRGAVEPTITTTFREAVAWYKFFDDASFEGKTVELIDERAKTRTVLKFVA